MNDCHDPIEIVPYNPQWPLCFKAEAQRLQLAVSKLERIEHIGSTAVPSLAAKPVIDILLLVRPPVDLAGMTAVLADLGYAPRPAAPSTDVCFYVRRDERGIRTHHLHLVASGGGRDQRLVLRDFLRTHELQAREYEALKRELATRFRCDREAYIEAKTDFINTLLALAAHPR